MLLDRFKMLTSQYGNLEVLIAVDNGDDGYAQEIKAIDTPFVCKVLRRDRSDNFSNDYYNWLAGQCHGDAIQCFNDDAYYLTKNWDEIIAERVRGQDIWLADLLDSTRFNSTGEQPCFPMVSRKGYETLGFVLHPQIKVYPADRKIYEVYKEADRVIKIHEVRIQHDRVASDKLRLEEISRKSRWGNDVDVSYHADKIRKQPCLVS